MNVESRVKKGEAAPAEMGHNSAAIEEKRKNLYHNNKNRVFVRAIAGEYNVKEELTRLRSVPRVRKAKDLPFVDGPACYSRHYIEPKDGVTQTFHMHGLPLMLVWIWTPFAPILMTRSNSLAAFGEFIGRLASQPQK